ncbi:hypothetical protein BV20DRAFT_174160 [Pilatotrama ljubarskyi]|nr:hypothetical protein BV20DRAFT_174160 [Pilatotrama ljubarskyi]
MPPSLASSLGLPSLDSTIGAVYIGNIVGAMLYGVEIYQVYKYHTLYPKDRPLLKGFVVAVLVIETFHSILWAIVGYHSLITEAFSVAGLLELHWSVRLTVLITGFTIFISQSFYAHRVYFVGPRYRWLVIPAVVSMVTGLSFDIAAGIESFTTLRYFTDFKRISWLVSIAYGFAVSSDVLLTGALVYVLRRSRTGSKRTDSTLEILIKYTINTGLLTSIFSALVFIFAIILPGDLVYAGISIVGAKLYANSVLAVLNSRKSIDNRFMDDFTSFNLPEISKAGGIDSMVYRIPQRAICFSDDTSRISMGMSFATGSDVEGAVPSGRARLKTGGRESSAALAVSGHQRGREGRYDAVEVLYCCTIRTVYILLCV